MNQLSPVSLLSPTALSKYVARIDCYDLAKTELNTPIQMYPEGVIEIVFQLGAQVSHKTRYNNNWENRHNAFVGGLHTTGYLIQASSDTKLLAIRFKPGMAKYFIPVDLCHFTNGIVAVEDIWPIKGTSLVAQLEEQQTLKEQVNLLYAFLFEQFDDNRETAIDQTVHFICRKNGLVDLKSLAELACLSTAQFRKRFKAEVGISPKYFARIIRVNAIIDTLKKQSISRKLGDVAYQFNYFDQSHFNHDFKTVTGCLPKTFL